MTLSTTHVYTILSTSSPFSHTSTFQKALSFFHSFLFPFSFSVCFQKALSIPKLSGSLNFFSLFFSFFFYYQNSFSSLSFSRTLFCLFLFLFLLLFLFFTVTSLIETEIEISLYGSYSSNVLPFLSLHAFHVKHQV